VNSTGSRGEANEEAHGDSSVSMLFLLELQQSRRNARCEKAVQRGAKSVGGVLTFCDESIEESTLSTWNPVECDEQERKTRDKLSICDGNDRG
jgi:hypothetical protein